MSTIYPHCPAIQSITDKEWGVHFPSTSIMVFAQRIFCERVAYIDDAKGCWVTVVYGLPFQVLTIYFIFSLKLTD